MRESSTIPPWIAVPAGLIARLFYRVRVIGGFHVPRTGGAVVIANHLSCVDVVALQLACPRPLRFVAYKDPGAGWLLAWVFKRARVIIAVPLSRKQWLTDSVKALEQGELVCVFPEMAISRGGQLMALRSGFELIARMAGVPVIPAAIDGIRRSIPVSAGNGCRWTFPSLLPTSVCVAFGEPIPCDAADRITARRALMELGVLAFAERPVLRGHVGREAVRALARRPGSVVLIDRASSREEITSAKLIAAVAVLSRRLKKTVAEGRVGIVLPSGSGAVIANLAVVCAGKAPVNFEFNMREAPIRQSLEEIGVHTVITSQEMRSLHSDFPWPARILDLCAEIDAGEGKFAMARWVAAAWLLPNKWVADLIGIPANGDHEEAALVLTGGVGGALVGAVFSHRNILASCEQFASLSVQHDPAVVLGCLPLTRSFGFPFTVWYPLVHGCRLVMLPSELGIRAVIEAISGEGVTALFSIPAFLESISKEAVPADLKSLDMVLTGAEGLPKDLQRGFRERFHFEICEGYGMTDTCPISSLNRPNPPSYEDTDDEQIGNKRGTVGRLLPGMSARIVDPHSGTDLPAGTTGLLLLQGANIFSLWPGSSGTGRPMGEGWLVTRDLAEIDEDGFVSIKGRLIHG